MRQKFFWFAPVLLLTCIAMVGAQAAVIEVTPTGTAADFENVRAALASANPGDTILLRAGTFNWTGNNVAVAPFLVPLGLPIPVSQITITGEIAANGEPLTIIAGPVDADGYPAVYSDYLPINAAFVNVPGVTGVTIRQLVFRNFEMAIGLAQGTQAAWDGFADPEVDFSQGADDSLIENLRIENCTGGISAVGAHHRLTIRNNIIQIVAKDGLGDDSGGFIINANAINSLTNYPYLPDAPVGLVIENNITSGPGPYPQLLMTPVYDENGNPVLDENGNVVVQPWWVFTVGIGVQGANGARVEGNTVSGFGSGISVAAEGTVQILRNSQSNGQIGLRVTDLSPLPKCTGVPGSASAGAPSAATSGALVRNNRFTGNVYFPPLQSYWLNGGLGIAVNSDNNQFVGNNVEGNEIAGIRIVEDTCTNPVRPNRTATGNLILGNGTVVMGSPFVLTNNTISGSRTSLMNVGQAIGELPPAQRPPWRLP